MYFDLLNNKILPNSKVDIYINKKMVSSLSTKMSLTKSFVEPMYQAVIVRIL